MATFGKDQKDKVKTGNTSSLEPEHDMWLIQMNRLFRKSTR